jgi:hypothetical protein
MSMFNFLSERLGDNADDVPSGIKRRIGNSSDSLF